MKNLEQVEEGGRRSSHGNGLEDLKDPGNRELGTSSGL